MSRLVTLQVWAKHEFGDYAPCGATLSRYAKFQMMQPPAVKVGNRWMIEKNAKFVGAIMPCLSEDDNAVLKRILMDGQT